MVAWYTQPYNLAVLQYNSTLEVEKSNKLKYVGQGFVHDVQYKKILYIENVGCICLERISSSYSGIKFDL